MSDFTACVGFDGKQQREEVPQDSQTPDPVNDIYIPLKLALDTGPRAFKKIRKQFNGDGTLKYRAVASTAGCISVHPRVMLALHAMMDVVAVDNVERPFMLVFDDAARRAVDLVVGSPGDEGSCCHDASLVAAAQSRVDFYNLQWMQQQQFCPEVATGNQSGSSSAERSTAAPPPVYVLSRGHTHPVFYGQHKGYGYNSCHHDSSGNVDAFGALPSNVYGCWEEWRERRDDPETKPGYREVIEQQIIRPRAYKRHCEDYIESYHSSHSPGFDNGPTMQCSSRFHWIVTPRLRQMGVFEVPKEEYGTVVYHPWVVEER